MGGKYKVESVFYEKAIQSRSLSVAVKEIGTGVLGSEIAKNIRGKVLKSCTQNQYRILTSDQVKDVHREFILYQITIIKLETKSKN